MLLWPDEAVTRKTYTQTLFRTNVLLDSGYKAIC